MKKMKQMLIGCACVFLLALSFHLGASTAQSQTPQRPHWVALQYWCDSFMGTVDHSGWVAMDDEGNVYSLNLNSRLKASLGNLNSYTVQQPGKKQK